MIITTEIESCTGCQAIKHLHADRFRQLIVTRNIDIFDNQRIIPVIEPEMDLSNIDRMNTTGLIHGSEPEDGSSPVCLSGSSRVLNA